MLNNVSKQICIGILFYNSLKNIYLGMNSVFLIPKFLYLHGLHCVTGNSTTMFEPF